MMLTQCMVFVNLSPRIAAQNAELMVRFAAHHALVVDHVAIVLDHHVFAQIAQLMVPCDAPHAMLVDHVALALDERVELDLQHLTDTSMQADPA